MSDRPSADATSATHDEMVFFGQGRSMPRDLYRRARQLFKLFWIAGLSPFVMFVALAIIPSSFLMVPAKLLNELFWVHIRPATLEHCSGKCHMMAYSLIGVPLSWLAAIVFAIWAVRLALQNWDAGQEAIRRGAAPFGRTPSGQVKQPPGLVMTVLATAFLGALLLGGLWVLYLLAGSDRTISRDRENWPPMISLSTTVIMGITQFLAVATMMTLTNVVLHLKKLLTT
ncbi:hypothetical protein BH11PSE3_BH11PSE3_06950 [soil metagenome]